jgi:arginase
MAITRREWMAVHLAMSVFPALVRPRDRAAPRSCLITAPSNLGLRPAPNGAIPGTWRAPDVLLKADIARSLDILRIDHVDRVAYDTHEQPGTRIRNGHGIRAFSLALADRVAASMSAGECPVVLGGDCSVLLGCLLGARWAGGRGLIHIDGHSDFFHPGNYDTESRLGSAAGMDLALATGRGEPLLTQWPRIEGALVADADAVQIGERQAEDPDYLTGGYGDIVKTEITRFTIQRVHKLGMVAVARLVHAHLEQRQLSRVWLHVDLDVLDQSVLDAVDSPGSPGLTAGELSDLIFALRLNGRIAGVDFTIYDPDLDPHQRYPRMLVECIAKGLAGR